MGVATQVNRLLRLQDSAGAAHIQRQFREQYGEQETVSCAAHRVLRLSWTGAYCRRLGQRVSTPPEQVSPLKTRS